MHHKLWSCSIWKYLKNRCRWKYIFIFKMAGFFWNINLQNGKTLKTTYAVVPAILYRWVFSGPHFAPMTRARTQIDISSHVPPVDGNWIMQHVVLPVLVSLQVFSNCHRCSGRLVVTSLSFSAQLFTIEFDSSQAVGATCSCRFSWSSYDRNRLCNASVGSTQVLSL